MDDLISEFITETAESLAVLDQELIRLESNPEDKEVLGNIFRLVHTIKGTCGFLGLPRLETVAHAGENVLGKLRDGELRANADIISIILEALDTIKFIMDYLSQNGEEPQGNDDDLKARLNATANGETPSAAAAPTPAAEAEPVAAAPTTDAMPEPEPDEFGFVPVPASRTAELAEAVAAQAAAPVPEPVPEPSVPVPAPAPAQTLADPIKTEAVEAGLKAVEAAAPKAAGGGDVNLANQSIRVNLDVLENLMTMVSELVLTRNQLLQMIRDVHDSKFAAPIERLSHITTELQEGVMKTRMQPIGNAWSKFPRLVRDLSHDLGKKIDLRMIGAETELDRQLLEYIKDPLTHMVRNSADHGLEQPADRKAAGKPETGTVTLSAYHEGGHIIIEVGDDGRGLNIDKIKEKAIQNNLATEAELAALTEQQIMQFIFKPGFSTAAKVTSVSGRGVGMDVVRTNIEKIGGTIEMRSKFGHGSTFFIKIPLTLAIVSVLIVECKEGRYAIPQINVVEMVRAGGENEHAIEMISQSPVLRLRERLLPLLPLSAALGLDAGYDPAQETEDGTYIVVCNVGGYDFGVIVDRVFDTEEIVVKPVSPILSHIEIYSGSTILGDGSVIMILDPNGLAKAICDVGMQEQNGQQTQARHASLSERRISFLLFKAGEGAPKAVPLELVSRLEEIDVRKIEHSGAYPVIQYRGELMRLITLDPMYRIPDEGIQQVIVFTYDNKSLGLMVESIVDIVDEALAIKLSSQTAGYLGSMVIDGRTTDVIDAGYLLSQFIGDICAIDSDRMEDVPVTHHVLLVDDSPFFRNITAPYLSSLGYEVTVLEGAVEAMKMLQEKHRFSAIVTDIEMPEVDGFTFATFCRQSPNVSHVPVIGFSSRVNDDAIAKGNEAGLVSLIPKTDRDRLAQVLRLCMTAEKEAA